MKPTFFFLFTALIPILSAHAQDGPFGINMGDDPEKLGCTFEESTDFVYRCKDVSRPHPDVEIYVVWSFPETGVAFAKALGKTHEGDKYGTSVRTEIDRIAGQIASKYGAWTDHDDFIRSSGIWTDADEWAASVDQSERFYDYSWKFEDNEQLNGIHLSAQAINLHNTFFVIDFEFENKDRFDDVRENRGSNAF